MLTIRLVLYSVILYSIIAAILVIIGAFAVIADQGISWPPVLTILTAVIAGSLLVAALVSFKP